MIRHAFLLAAPQSGSGKTTISLSIMAALKRRGVTVAPFKCGPDFIDPGYHRSVCGCQSINLDAWMCSGQFVQDTFNLHAAKAEVAIIEGVMGLFDGFGASTTDGSSARIAALTGAPVVLVVNARGMAASAAALVKGFASFDPQIKVVGVIFNNVGGESHAELLRNVMSEHLPEMLVFGCIPRDESLLIPTRHLGLVTVEDNPLPPEFLERLAEMAECHLDLDGLAGLKAHQPQPPLCRVGSASYPLQLEVGKRENGVQPRIALASDAAFCFVYEDNLRLLREAGADIVPFSPLDDITLPPDINCIYLPGGYPELYAERLAANTGMLAAILAAVWADMPVYAECGGFVYLTQGMEEAEELPHANFVGIFPVRCRMLPRRKALGYRQVELVVGAIAGGSGAICRGHEFHYSDAGAMPETIERCYRVSRQGVMMGLEGFRVRNCLASYIHLHFGSNPEIAASLLSSCNIIQCKER